MVILIWIHSDQLEICKLWLIILLAFMFVFFFYGSFALKPYFDSTHYLCINFE